LLFGAIVFGVKLSTILEREKRKDGIPTILVKCVEYLEGLPLDQGLAAEGIFRVSANQAEVAAMKEYFNMSMSWHRWQPAVAADATTDTNFCVPSCLFRCCVADPAQYDIAQFKYNVHTIAGVLRLWFRNLPEPLLGFDLYEPLLSVQRMYMLCQCGLMSSC
jgi:hypothetical protein